MTSPAIIFENVTKTYRGYYHLAGGYRHFLFNFREGIKQLRKRSLVLEDISFQIDIGESFGIIGRNGAGKSTMLGLMAGVLMPNAGRVRVFGRLSPMLELGSGFHHELTGRENIVMSGVLLGLKRAEVLAKIDEIITFSGLYHYIDQPIRTYSTGMLAKLGFAIIAYMDPKIMLIDEVLAVGDIDFQERSLAKMEEFRQRPDVTFVLVSHAMPTIRKSCQRVAWIKDCRLHMIGPADEVTEAYEEYYFTSTSSNPIPKIESPDIDDTKDISSAEPEVDSISIGEDRSDRVFRHCYPHDWVAPAAGFAPKSSAPVEEDVAFASRLGQILLEEKTQSLSHVPDCYDGVSNHLSKREKIILSLCEKGDHRGAANYLNRIFQTELANNLAQGAGLYRLLKHDLIVRKFISKVYFDYLISLAESFGAVSAETPELGDWGCLALYSPDDLLEKIDHKLKKKLQFPNFNGGHWGLETNYGNVSPLDIQAIYIANRFNAIIGDNPDARIVEIGNGIGHNAFHALSFGYKDYTQLNTPIINLAQAWFLAQNLPDTHLILPDISEPFSTRPALRVLPTRFLDKIPYKYFDILLSVGILNVMPERSAVSYLRELRGKTKYLFSISHEATIPEKPHKSNFKIADLVRKAKGYKLLSRHSYWIRTGYVEELYQAN